MTEGVQATPKQRSPWVYVLLGCGGVVLLMGIAAVAVLVAGARFASSVTAGLTDPKVQAEKTTALLGTMPVGYSPMMALSVPLMLDVVALAKPKAGQTLDAANGMEQTDRSFFYFRVTESEGTKGLRGWFEGEDGSEAALRKSGLNFEVKETLGRGALNLEGRKVLYVASRGTMRQSQVQLDDPLPSGPQAQGSSGLATLVFFECPADGKLRAGIWMQADPQPGVAGEQVQTQGTVADVAQLKAFLGPLTPCGR